MDVPVLTAVIGISGTLLGAIVVGCTTTYTNFLLNKHREQAEFRIGCRLVAAELYECETFISSMIDTKRRWLPEQLPETKAWEEHKRVFASYFSDTTWRELRTAVLGVQLARHYLITLHEAGAKTIQDKDIPLLNIYVQNIQKGYASLQLYLTGATPPQAAHPWTIRAGMTR
jgi:hypothetical protein